MPIYWKTRVRIEKAVYESGINVALFNVENGESYKGFHKKLEKELYNQIKQVAVEKIVYNLLLFTKIEKPSEGLIQAISSYITSLIKNINLASFLYKMGELGGQAFLDKVGIDGTFILKNPELIAYFDDYSNLIIDSVDDYTKEWIARVIQTGKDEGLSPAQIVDMLIEEGKGISKIRAERIVLTETAKAMTTVELEMAVRYGIKEVIWRTSYDERVCPECLALEGYRTQINVGFVSEGWAGNGPPRHVVCRCFLEEVVPEDWFAPTNGWLGE